MSNSADTKASREEETAFLIMEQILGVDIRLADAGTGNKKPDGAWTYPDGRRGVVEITSPPDTALIKRWAQNKRDGTTQTEAGSIPVRFGELDRVCQEILATSWARDNIEKLCAQLTDERHLFLFGRSFRVSSYFYRLSGECEEGRREQVADLNLPAGVTDVWFRGRASREEPYTTRIQVSRFQFNRGWSNYLAEVDERQLPSPHSSIAEDRLQESMRNPKNRTR